uniref:Flavin-containing monooxygenase n=1 Tax=Oreochromis niloticus TaxID=8128 RepID=I3J3L5_ORENI
MTHRVAIVGGGASGLASIKCCLDEGLEPVCFESSNDIGGLWRVKENPEPDRASIYFSVIINSSKEMMCFSDFPIPAHFPNYMHNSLIMDYFRLYADHFHTDIYKWGIPALLSTTCFCLFKSDFSHSGEWVVETENKDGKKEKHVFEAVMICIGHHCYPNMPLHDFPGIETFTGKYFHSRDYKTPEGWRNKNVIVIGIGNSGADIAVELSRVTKQVYLMFDFLRKTVPFGFFCSLGERRLNKIFDHTLYNLKPKHRLLSQYPTLNDELPNRILSGTVQVKPNICRFQGSSVEFDDGSVVEDVDLVIFATGYRYSFPFLASQVVSVSNNKASLYKYVFPPELERPTLAIIGLVQPLGSIMPISELQARWATRVFKGCIKLPSVVVMLKDIQWKQAAMAQRYVTSQRHTIQVDSVSYMDEIAELVGVQPNIPRMLLTDPRLGMNVLFGPCTPYQYRLRGPGKWAGARQAILTQWERVTQPLQTRPCDELKPRRSYKWPLLLSAAALFFTVCVKRNNLQAFLQDPTSLLDRVKMYLPTQ